MEVIIPIKIKMPSVRIEIPEKANVEVVAKDLDTTNELREAADVRMESHQQRLENLHNRRLKPRTFLLGELVLRRVFENTTNPTYGKFQPNWEGSCTAVQVGIVRSYALSRPDGTAVPRMWNVMHLKKYYQ